MTEIATYFKNLAEAYPDATITLKELNKVFSDAEVGIELDAICVDKGSPDTPYLANGDPGNPGWEPEFEYTVEGLTFEGENVSVTGVDYQTIVMDLNLTELADEATNKLEDC